MHKCRNARTCILAFVHCGINWRDLSVSRPVPRRPPPWSSVLGATSAAGAPLRMAMIFLPNGVHYEDWTPTGEGKDYTAIFGVVMLAIALIFVWRSFYAMRIPPKAVA